MKTLKTLLVIIPVLLLQLQVTAQDVPYVPTSPEVVNGMLELAQVDKDDIVYDLGCGDGRIVIAAAKDFGARGVGVDSNPERIEESIQNAKLSGVDDQVVFKEQNLFETDITDATVVTLYLLSSVNYKLRPKLFEELRPGTRVVSHAFTMDEWEPDAHRIVDNRDIYLWIVPVNFSGTWIDDLTPVIEININQEFDKISGSMLIGERKIEFDNAEINGESVTLNAMDKGQDIKFTGEITESGLLTGTVLSSDNTLNQKFNGKRVDGSMKPLDPQLR